VRVRGARRLLDLVVARVEPAVPDVLADGAGEQQRLLQHDAALATHGGDRQVPQVDAVEQHPAVRRVDQPGQQAHQRRLARAGRADQGDQGPGGRDEADAAQRALAVGVVEVHPLEADLATGLLKLLRSRAVEDLDLGVTELERRLQVDQLLLELGQGAADGRQRGVDGSHVGQHDQQLADGQRARITRCAPNPAPARSRRR
jgi:hypothetical protein